jgi:hypothetical protein
MAAGARTRTLCVFVWKPCHTLSLLTSLVAGFICGQECSGVGASRWKGEGCAVLLPSTAHLSLPIQRAPWVHDQLQEAP